MPTVRASATNERAFQSRPTEWTIRVRRGRASARSILPKRHLQRHLPGKSCLRRLCTVVEYSCCNRLMGYLRPGNLIRRLTRWGRSRGRLIADRRSNAAVSIPLLQFQQLTHPSLKFGNCRLTIVTSRDRTRRESMTDNAPAAVFSSPGGGRSSDAATPAAWQCIPRSATPRRDPPHPQSACHPRASKLWGLIR
jgi:hypothetical protein